MIQSLFDKSIRVCFTNFWPDLKLKDINYFLNVFINNHTHFRIIKHYKPHVQFFSIFGDIKELKRSKTQIKIFYTGENINQPSLLQYQGNCLDSVDLSLGFDYMDTVNYLRHPLWLLYFFTPNNSKDEIKDILDNFNKKYEKSKFCSLISRHDNYGLRTKMYNDISNIGTIDCPGKLLHNDDTLQNIFNNNKLLYLQQYKFNICPENTKSEGYVTEKIFECLYSGCIPIYSGWSKNPEPDIINPNIILIYDEFDSQNNKSVFNEIKKLHENDRLYRSFTDQPFFCDTAVDKIHDFLSNFNEKMENIFCKLVKK